ncbi:MAG: transcriptional repressor [Candidatus Latescibacteria bacterium]|nr:transcriptional repressor [Candidatus Latescibacterota bacterium]
MTDSPEILSRLARYQAAAKAAGVKLTHQRLEIFREVASSLEHPDAESVFRAVQIRLPTVSLDTVYRTLWLLHDLGLVATLGPRRGSVRFDANLEPHHHYVCTRCGLARDFTSAELDVMRIPDAVQTFGSIVTTHVEVRGVCGGCAAKSAAAGQPDLPPSGQEARRET